MLDTEVKIDPRVKRTRQLLQQAFRALLDEKPLSDITVQDIAARAEVNRATFYAHFTDKYDLLNASVREMFQARLAAELPPDPTMNLDNLRKLMLIISDYMGQTIGHCLPTPQFSDHALMMMQVQMSLDATIRDWMSHTESGLCAESEAAARLLSWAIWGSVFQWAREGRKIPREQMVDQVITLLKSGLLAYLPDMAQAS